jgi:TusA-related sulfurtransferase
MEVNGELNLRGEVCPYTFVKTKLALEEMEPGQLLRVIVDNAESAENVPRSLRNEGHAVLDLAQTGATEWAIVVRKA